MGREDGAQPSSSNEGYTSSVLLVHRDVFVRAELARLKARRQPIERLCRPRFGRLVHPRQFPPQAADALLGSLVHVNMIGLIKAEQHRFGITTDLLKRAIDCL